jgi:SAM-dependent methyltransferase
MKNNYPADDLATIFRVDNLPIFQNHMFRTAEEARKCATGNVVLVQDPSTGLIFNKEFRSDLLQYDSAYQNEQAVSAVFRIHLQKVLKVIEQHFAGLSLIEVGCGKGHFLETLQAASFDVTGLDPTYEGENPAVIKQYFSPEVGLRAEAIILRHVLEHVQNPVEFLRNIRDANGGKGQIYIEVPCLDWISKHRAWFDIFYEHVNYFRLPDFYRIFGHVHEAGHVFAGQYLYVIADLSSIRTPILDRPASFRLPPDILSAVDVYAKQLEAQGAKNSAIWGGASKGVIFALYMHRAGIEIDLVFDINPAKQGKYLPLTGILVQPPERATELLSRGANVFVMNGNYLQEVADFTHNRFSYITVDHDSI